MKSPTLIPLAALHHNGTAVIVFKNTEGKGALYTAGSTNGITFKVATRPLTIEKTLTFENILECDHFKLSFADEHFILSYERTSQKSPHKKEIVFARSKDLKKFKVFKQTTLLAHSGFVIPIKKHDYVLYNGTPTITLAASKDLLTWKNSGALLIASRSGFFDHGRLTIIAAHSVPEGIAILYQCSELSGDKEKIMLGAALITHTNPFKVFWRSENPIWEQEYSRDHVYRVFGAIFKKEKILLYITCQSGELSVVTLPNIFHNIRATTRSIPSIKRHSQNPMIAPDPAKPWQSEGTFNPAALYLGGKVHILFRAIGPSGLSMVGYATSKDGINVDEIDDIPAYIPREPFEGARARPPKKGFSFLNASGGGWGGCEDPKLTLLDNRVYITYVAHNGYGDPRGAISSISVDDFLARRWEKWTKAKLITEPKVTNKSLCLLPEKIDDNYVFFHRVFPNILIDYVPSIDDLGEKKNLWLRSLKKIPIRPTMWDSRKLSVGATPIKTKKGWLTIYHAVDDRDASQYKMGAMLLDLKDPSHVLHRTNAPILTPEMHYENHYKPGVIYPCGAVVVGKELFIYYGGGDRHVCVAHAPLKKVLDELEKDNMVHIAEKKVIIS